jgi:hypothetical protein
MSDWKPLSQASTRIRLLEGDRNLARHLRSPSTKGLPHWLVQRIREAQAAQDAEDRLIRWAAQIERLAASAVRRANRRRKETP